VEAMKKGAFDFLTKPFDTEELMSVVEAAAQKHRASEENAYARRAGGGRAGDCFSAAFSPSMLKIFKSVDKVASSDYTILIEGESGTGKSMIAREIHERSARRKGPFVTVDCGTLPDNLIESELFGFEKGSFTGAQNRKTGKIERADGGTLFIDEISSLNFQAQAAFLNLLQNKEFERIGGCGPRLVDVRIIAASNRDLKRMVCDKTFRHDLYYRLKVFTLTMPALRERAEDILPLAYFFLHKLAPGRDIQFTSAAASKLRGFEWPGNIRELENSIKHALILLGDGSTLDSRHLPLEMEQGYWTARSRNISLKQMLDNAEKRLIQQALLENDMNIDKCARMLKISRRTLYYRLKQFDIDLGEII
ncbi:MAG: sigma-54 dependent transcriptional regulator, partial [Deltaproteobacteria bacterium]|nr:sigma-54 dependent transcriptional regulator [Deltaproteobacteria bacterium]